MHESETPSVSVVIVCYRQRELLLEAVTAARVALDALGGSGELLVMDNSESGELGQLVSTREPSAQVVAMGGNAGFAGAVADAVSRAQSRWVALINDDAVIAADALSELLAIGESSPNVGSVAAAVRWRDRPDELNSAGIAVDVLGVAFERFAGAPAAAISETPIELFGASGCVALYRRSMLEAIGGFDGSFFAYQEDVDVAWRARAAGWRCLLAPRATATHAGSASTGEGSARKYRLVGRNRIRLLAKNASTAQLLRWGWAMALYDLAYVTFVALTDRTLAPLRGRLEGLREWRHYRRAGASTRGNPEMSAGFGPIGALRQRAAYRR
jgi:GT2 family glycosyltransferase